MKAFKAHKRDSKLKGKNHIGDTNQHGKSLKNKEKYNHKNHWIEEEMAETVPLRKKKKKSLV